MVGVVIRSGERYDLVNIKPTDGRKKNTDSTYDSVAYDQVAKTVLSESKAEAEEFTSPIARFRASGPLHSGKIGGGGRPPLDPPLSESQFLIMQCYLQLCYDKPNTTDITEFICGAFFYKMSS